MMHLALGARTRTMQLAYIRELIGDYKHQVLMGAMNTHANDLLQNSPLRDLGLLAPQVEATFPSWRPQRCLRSEEHTSELQSLMRISYAVFCLTKNTECKTSITLPQDINKLNHGNYTNVLHN